MKKEDGEEVEPFIRAHIPHVQQQKGDSNCGVFAIAFALHAILGDDMTNIHFDQTVMRSHLLHCLQTKHFDRFPTVPKPKKSIYYYFAILPISRNALHCNCLMPEKDDMVMCDACEDWYHFRCIGLDKTSISRRAVDMPLLLIVK